MSETPNYAIFISYRRDGGAQYARILKNALENRGYSKRVFLDHDALRDGRFDSRIMNAIEMAPIFIFILSPGALDRCVNEDDWVRKEILYALNHERHIIPINFDNLFNGFPKNIPTEIREGLDQHQFTEIESKQRFDSSMELLINNRIAPLVTPFNHPTNVGAEIAILTDADCYVNRYNKLLTTAHANEVSFIHLQKGNHILEFVSTECPDVKETIKEYYVPDNNYNDYIEIKLKDKINQPHDNITLISIKDSSGKWGFIDKFGNLVIHCQYDDAYSLYEGFAPVKNSSGKWGLINKNGTLVIPHRYNYIGYFFEGLALVEDSSSKWGFIDKLGNLAIPCKFNYANNFSEGLANIRDTSNNAGFIDKLGNFIIPCKYNYANDFSEGLALVEDASQHYSFIDKAGKHVIPSSYDCFYSSTLPFSDGLARIKDSSQKYGFIDKLGNLVIPCIYNDIESFHCGLARIKDSFGKYGFIDKSGKQIIQCIYDDASNFTQGIASIKNSSGKWGLIDESGNQIIPCTYDDAKFFRDGMVRVKNSSGKWGLIDKSGNLVIPCIYDDIQ